MLFGGPVFTPSLIKSNRSFRCDSQRVQLSERDEGETSTAITFSAFFWPVPSQLGDRGVADFGAAFYVHISHLSGK